MAMITVPERVEYRKALGQLYDLKDQLDYSISRGTPLDLGVALAMEKMAGTDDVHGQYRALNTIYTRMDAQYDEKLRYAAQFRFSPFCEYMYRNEPPAFHHEFLIEHMEAVHNKDTMRLAVSMPPGSAKALALDTPIPTPDGWKNMGELKVGDKVFDENGNPCNITAVSPVFHDRPVYQVKTDCGDTIIADRDHEWNARLCSKRPVFKNHETHVLSKDRTKRPMIKRAKSLKYTTTEQPIDPYFLGIWLGDGTASSVSVTCDVEDQKFLIPQLNSLGYTTTERSSPMLFGVTGVRHLFTQLGLINDPHHNTFGKKHIPAIYMQGDEEQRLSLLQGLIDSDGTVCKKRGITTFCNTNKVLAEQVQELVRSLGVKAGFSTTRAMLYEKDCGEAYKVSFYLENSARLPRKQKLTRNQNRTPNTYIDVDYVGTADTVCISVDSESSLFLCGKSMTPTHNSSYASIRFAAWHLGRRPDDRWLQGAHGQTFAKDRLGKPVRNLIQQARYRNIFPDRGISATSSAADYFEFSNSNVSYYKAIGVGQGISGFRADIGAIDDPIASREQAESPTIRNKLHEWFEDDFGTRPMPGSPIFVVATRWHEDDLIGYELEKMASGTTAYPWEVVNIPALAEDDDPLGREPGEGLWPEVFGTEWYTLKKLDSTARSWNSLYQGKPSDEEGGVLKASYISRWKTPPKDLKRKDGSLFKRVIKRTTLSVDCAEKATQRSDWTAATVWVETHDKKHYLIHAARCRKEFTDMTKWIDSLARAFDVDQVLVEDKGAGTQYLQVRKQEPGPAPCIPISTNNNSKQFRFDGVTPMFEAGLVFFPEKGADWIADLEDELLKFPNGKNDDYVDSVSQYLNSTRKSRVKKGMQKVNSGYR